MANVATMIAAAITYSSAIAGCVYLTLNNHPVVGVVVLLVGLSASFKTHHGKAED